MSDITAKKQFRSVVEQAISTAIADSRLTKELRGIALFNPERDTSFKSLSSFDLAKLAVTKIPHFTMRFGIDEAERVVLQFIYEYFKRVDEVRYEETVFEALWLDFTAEIQQTDWVDRGVANVRNLRSDSLHIELGDGVAIRGRKFDELSSLGFGAAVREEISRDWGGFGSSSLVLVVEQAAPKRPDNVIEVDGLSLWTKAIRAVRALRLAAAGDVGIGPMWVVRVARFNPGIGGINTIGGSVPAGGSDYIWTEEVGPVYQRVYRELAHLERVGYEKAPGNLDLALRSFMATYDRWPPSPDSKLLDTITALEAVLGSRTEIGFKLAFRVAALLAPNDEERSTVFQDVKGFYNTRSALAHGAPLNKTHQGRLERVNELRSLVRALLRSFVALAADPPDSYDRSLFERQLDAALVNATEREKLRAALGLGRN